MAKALGLLTGQEPMSQKPTLKKPMCQKANFTESIRPKTKGQDTEPSAIDPNDYKANGVTPIESKMYFLQKPV
jgi:phosphate starvation-inducible protein PhoH